MSARVVRRGAGVLVGVLVLLAIGYLAARPPGDSPPPGSTDTPRLGPEPGEVVASYLARLPALLPADGAGQVLVLVQFDAELDDPGAQAAVAGARPVQVVFRVPLTRVQTALRFEPLGDGALALELDIARERARRDALRDAGARDGRAAAVAAAEARVLAQPCRCVLALVVQADRTALNTIGTRPGVRAVHAAPVGTDPGSAALSPLLPEQLVAAVATPDDGPVSAG